MALTTKLEKLVGRLEKIEKLPADIAKQEIEEIQDVVYPILEEEYQEMLAEAYKEDELDKDTEQIINKAEDLFVKIDSLISEIQTKLGLDIEALFEGEFDDDLERTYYDDVNVNHNDDEEVSSEEIEILYNGVAKSALRTIGDMDNDPQTISVMGDILALLASGEKDDDVIASKVLASMMLSGFYVEHDELKAMCSKTRELCGLQVFGLQIAIDSMREYKCSAHDALMQISKLFNN